MSERHTIGQILMNFGRISEEHVEKAIEYQRENGGYFGQALLALGFVSQEELEWSLASQYDLPYVFPDADTIDPEAAALVSPEWALAHLTLPIMKTAETLTVIVDSPVRSEAVDELQLRTDLKIEIALASAGKIRDLVRQVYARAAASEDGESRVPVSLREAFGAAMDFGSRRFGISTRGPRAIVWYKEQGRMRRRPLEGGWREELETLVLPSPKERTEGAAEAEWTGHLDQNGILTPLESRFLSAGNGSEYLFRPAREEAVTPGGFSRPGQNFLEEVRLLARSGSARFLVTTEPRELGTEILPHLPALLLDPSWRSIHVTDRDVDVPGVFSVRLPDERTEQSATFLTLHPFSFDIVSGDISTELDGWVTPLLNLAPCAFALPPEGEDSTALQAAREAGIRWALGIARTDGDALEWSLRPLKG